MQAEAVAGSRAARGRRVLAVLAMTAAACARQAPELLVQPVGETHTTASSTGGARPQGADTPFAPVGVVVGEDVRRACNLPPEPRSAPRFDVDSARLRPRGEDILARVAACVASGKLVLEEEQLTVVGHTDARGDESYNEQLGRYRAIAAKQYLVDHGVPVGKVTAESRGGRDARGIDEASWALDRTIEIRFGRTPGEIPR